MYTIKRKLYTRGSSYETTIPTPLLFSTQKNEKYDVIFKYDSEKNKWYIEIEKREDNKKNKDEKL